MKRCVRRMFLLLCGAVSLVVLPVAATPDWVADPKNDLAVRAAAAADGVRQGLPQTADYFEDAYAFAIWPSVKRVAFGWGAGFGKGIVVEGDKAVGRVKFRQLSSGLQAGAKSITMIMFFADAEALQSFKDGRTRFLGQAGVSLGKSGAHTLPAYNDGVAIFGMTNFGVMAEFSVSGARFKFRPYPESE